MASLLEQAKAIAARHVSAEVNDELLELVMAYANREISAEQGAKALGVADHVFQSRVRNTFISAIRSGKLVQK